MIAKTGNGLNAGNKRDLLRVALCGANMCYHIPPDSTVFCPVPISSGLLSTPIFPACFLSMLFSYVLYTSCKYYKSVLVIGHKYNGHSHRRPVLEHLGLSSCHTRAQSLISFVGDHVINSIFITSASGSNHSILDQPHVTKITIIRVLSSNSNIVIGNVVDCKE